MTIYSNNTRDFSEGKLARGVCSSWHASLLQQNIMSRASIAEAVLKNVLYFFDNTKHKREGAVISCRQFLLAVCFHKHGFPKNTFGARKLAEVTKINRKTLATHFNSKELLKEVRCNIIPMHLHHSSLPYNIMSVNRLDKQCFVK